jgi:hypothetical protein
VEIILIVLAGVLLGQYGLGSFVPSAVAFIAGFHFFPLAMLFKVKAYLTMSLECYCACWRWWHCWLRQPGLG